MLLAKFMNSVKIKNYIFKIFTCIFFGIAAGVNISLPLGCIITISSLSVIFLLIKDCTKIIEKSFLIFIWAIGFITASTFWIVIAIYDPLLTPLSTACIVAASLYATHALIYASTYYLLNKSLTGIFFIYRLTSNSKKNAKYSLEIISFALCFGIAEVVRAQGFWAMPWGFIGYTQTANPFFLSIYPVAGAYAVTIATTMLSILLVLLGESIYTELKSASHFSYINYIKSKISFFAIIVVFLTLLFLTQYIEWTQSTNKTVQVRVVHTHIPNMQKYAPEEQLHSLQKIIDLSSFDDADLTLYSELYLVKPAHGIDKFSRKKIVDSVLATKNAQIFGSPDSIVSESGHTSGSLNVMLQIDEFGQTKRYAKEILLPFSEYMPTHPLLVWAMPYIFKFPLANFSSGSLSNAVPLQVKNINLAISICNEIAYTNNIHHHAANAQILINSASDSWIPNRLYAMHSWQINRVRALEAQKPLLRSNNTGFSGYIDAWGNDKPMEYELEATEKYEIHPRFGNTPYTNFISYLSKI